MVVKIITKSYWYNRRGDKLSLNSIEVRNIEVASVREAMDLVMEINTTMTDDETLVEMASGNCKMVTTYAIPMA